MTAAKPLTKRQREVYRLMEDGWELELCGDGKYRLFGPEYKSQIIRSNIVTALRIAGLVSKEFK